MPENNESRITAIWKWLSTFLAGVILAGVPFFVLTANKVDAGEVRTIVRTDSPYVQDKQVLHLKLDEIQATLDRQARFQASQAQVWHDILCLAESEIQTSPDSKISPEEKVKALLFYDRALILAHADPCKGIR